MKGAVLEVKQQKRNESVPPPGWCLAIVQNGEQPECWRDSPSWARLDEAWAIYDQEHGLEPTIQGIHAITGIRLWLEAMVDSSVVSDAELRAECAGMLELIRRSIDVPGTRRAPADEPTPPVNNVKSPRDTDSSWKRK